jgi:hypothetical protein
MTSVLVELGTRKVHVDLDIAHDVIKASHAKHGQPALHWGKVNGQSAASPRRWSRIQGSAESTHAATC